jgi:hypothetical protein
MGKDKVAIYVDFDECLIHGFTVTDGKNPTYEQVKRDFEVSWIADGKEMYAIVLRPGAKEFLKSLHAITPNVFILTAGQKEFQTRVATEASLIGLVKGLYGRDSTDTPQFPISVLIDDLEIQSSNTFKRCLQMGIVDKDTQRRTQHGPWDQNDTNRVIKTISKHYIKISHFDATNKNDTGFAEVLPQIQPKIDHLKKEFNDYLKEKIVKIFKESLI